MFKSLHIPFFKLLTSITLFHLSAIVLLHAQSTCQKVYASSVADVCETSVLTTDGGVIMGGFTSSSIISSYGAIAVVKTDSQGDSLWTKIYSHFEDYSLYDMQQTFDGGYILTGKVYSSSASNTDIFLMKIDATGDFLWMKTYDAINIIPIHPFASEEEMVSFITKEKLDAIIVDYGLMRNDPSIKYNGGDIINKINELREDYPAFILTQDVDQQGEEIDEKVKSTMILLKGDLNDRLPSVKRKITKFIKLYQKQNSEFSSELLDLITKRKETGHLTDKEIERLNFIDEKIELRMQGKRKFPSLLKDSENLNQLNKVLNDAEEYIQKQLKK